MVVDTHVHLRNIPGYLGELIETVGRLKIDRMFLFSAWPGETMASNEQVLEAHQKHPDIIIPFYLFLLGQENVSSVERAKREGYRGLKLINPLDNYNHQSYFPVWEACEELGMTVTFHTGIVGRSSEQVHYDIDSSRMKVIYLDRIARKFQNLTMFVAHLGNPDYGEACMMCRWHANMYFDLSGSTLKKKNSDFFEEMFWWEKQTIRYKDEFGRGPWEKILFGTDVTPIEMEDTKNDYDKLFSALKLPQNLVDAVMGQTASKLLELKET